MPPGALTVQGDGTCTVVPRSDEDTAAFEATLARFSELVCPTAGQRVYRLTAASIWRVMRRTPPRGGAADPETASTTALPPPLPGRSGALECQIDRLTLEADQGRLLLRRYPSPRPYRGAAPSTLGTFITPSTRCHHGRAAARHLSSSGETFDACGYPVLDCVPAGWQLEAAPAPPAATPVRTVAQPLPAPTGRRQAARVEGLRQLPRQCQATPKPGGAARTGSSPAPGSAGCMRRRPRRRGPKSRTYRRPAPPTRSWKTG